MRRIINHSRTINYRRALDRDSYRLAYSGRGGASDWTVSLDYAKAREDDVTLSERTSGATRYEGRNTLEYVDDLDHRQWTIKAAANTQVNDKHLLTYGFGYTRETGEGSRIKSAPRTWTKRINPWDYDKNLYSKDGTGAPDAKVRDHAMGRNADGTPYYDLDYERYGSRDAEGKTEVPAFTYEDYKKYGSYGSAPPDVAARRTAFGRQLLAENHPQNYSQPGSAIYHYYGPRDITWRGKKFNEESDSRLNRLRVGAATITRANVFVQDTWQITPDTLLTPILRVDRSSLFGTNLTFNLGMTHHIGGDTHRRFKANIGTGYTEPDMGELYYNWEL